jgi:hypothetical protein
MKNPLNPKITAPVIAAGGVIPNLFKRKNNPSIPDSQCPNHKSWNTLYPPPKKRPVTMETG